MQIVIVGESILTVPKEIQDRVNEFVIFVNQCFEENLRKEQKDKTD